ncbi:hypothetical protein [Paenibacillus pini]|uniref:Uncharacterized protein n=1 Tax=Paenibacillus pini JCM 16418 TaxID=1236976 RepID=W7Y6L2_9BACL|nr:hypothetical protein [Paenibacillus pini]GAF06550.1 hypothetical protein JCM16418_510 [Paenibacillus pini JCM 16418]
MIIEVDFGMHREAIEIEGELGKQIEQLQEQFLDWIYNKEIDHQYWIYKEGIKWGVSYRGSAFVEWLNNMNSNEYRKTTLTKDKYSTATKTIYF